MIHILRRTTVAFVAVVIALATGASAASGTAAAAAANPKQNIAPSPNYRTACYGANSTSATCIGQTLAAINRARRMEHVTKPMILPRNYAKLTRAQQTFVVTDLERVDRGLAPFVGLTTQLNTLATRAAQANADPSLASATMGTFQASQWGSIWAGDLGPLAADYDWMYDDGYAADNTNMACPSAASPGCWGHRDNILGTYRHQPTLLSGAGTATQPQWLSISQIFVAGTGKAPALAYTWKQSLAQGADGA